MIDAWAVRIRLDPEAARITLQSASRSLGAKAHFQLCAETLDVLPKQQADWMPEFKSPEERRLFAQACLNSFVQRAQYERNRHAGQIL